MAKRGIRIALTREDARTIDWCLEFAQRFMHDADSMGFYIGKERGPEAFAALVTARGLLAAAIADWPDELPLSEETSAEERV